MAKYNDAMEFMEENHRNPSKHRNEELVKAPTETCECRGVEAREDGEVQGIAGAWREV